jgi:hypothetical protein
MSNQVCYYSKVFSFLDSYLCIVYHMLVYAVMFICDFVFEYFPSVLHWELCLEINDLP